MSQNCHATIAKNRVKFGNLHSFPGTDFNRTGRHFDTDRPSHPGFHKYLPTAEFSDDWTECDQLPEGRGFRIWQQVSLHCRLLREGYDQMLYRFLVVDTLRTSSAFLYVNLAQQDATNNKECNYRENTIATRSREVDGCCEKQWSENAGKLLTQ